MKFEKLFFITLCSFPLFFIFLLNHGYNSKLQLIELMLKKGGNVHYFNGQFELIEGMKKYNGNKPEFKAVLELLEKFS